MGLMLKTVAPRQGLVWVQQGMREYLCHPLAYLALFVAFMFTGALISVIPVLGEILLLMGIPLLSLAYMMATLGSGRGAAPSLAVFIAPWRQLPPARRQVLFVVCLAYALLSLLAMALCDLIDGGNVEALITGLTGGQATPEELQRLSEAPGVVSGSIARVASTMLLGIPFWHAPALVVWGDQSPAQALFSSVLGLWRAKGAFLVYSLGWAAALAVAGTVLSLLLMALGNGALVGLVVMPIGMLLTAAYYVSLFFTFQDSFGQPD